MVHSLALGYCVKPTVNQTNCFRLGPNASTFSLMSVMTRLRKIIRTSDELPVSTFGLCDQLLDQPTDALNSPPYKLIEHSLFTASVIAFPAGQHEDQILLPQLKAHKKLPLFFYVALPLSVVQTWIDTACYRSLVTRFCRVSPTVAEYRTAESGLPCLTPLACSAATMDRPMYRRR